MIKKIIWVISLILLGSIMFSVVGCNNGKKNKESNEKALMLFEVDEGLGGYEFVAGCKTEDGSHDFSKIDTILNNVYSGIGKLQEKYDVGAHIYPNWYYKENGWNTEHSDGLQKWSKDFLYAMDFFKEKGIYVYLEYLSSTIYVSQNGENGRLPCVNVNHGKSDEEHMVWGVPCDFQALEALKKHYPETFRGLRFHELIGTDDLAMQGNPHACRIYEEDITAIVKEAKNLNLELAWSEQFWDRAFNSAEYWLDRVDNAYKVLGDNLIVMLANNAVDIPSVAHFKVYDQLKDRFPKSNLGYSNQAWFLDQLILGADTKCEDQHFIPAEVVAGFSQKALSLGAKIVQFEPFFHLFNYTRQGINGGTDYTYGGIAMNKVVPNYELIQGDYLDYSPKTELLRIVDYLLDDNFIFANINDCFDTSSAVVNSNNANNPPKLFSQTTMCFMGDDVKFYDSYNNNVGVWYNQNENRYTERVIDKNALVIGRISYTKGAFDDVLKVIKEDGKNIGYIYNSISGKVYVDKTTFADNSNGEFIGFCSVNLIQEKTYRGKDTDEIIVARQKDGQVKLSLYSANLEKDGFTEITGARASVIDDYFGSSILPFSNYLGVYNVRNSKAIGKTTCLRGIDGMVVAYKVDGGVKLFGKRSIISSEINQTIQLDGEIIGIAFGDNDFDKYAEEEMFICTSTTNGTKVDAYRFKTDKEFEKVSSIINLGTYKPEQFFVLQKYYYVNDITL